MNKSPLIVDNVKTVLLGCIYKWQQNALQFFNLEQTIFQQHCNFSKIFPTMLALCLMLSVTYYAQNYAGIIGWSLLQTLP